MGGNMVFHTLHELIDARVVATDGNIGKVCNVFFDDQSWKVRYFVVDLRGWRAHRYVVLSVSQVEPPDWGKKILRARASKEQVRHSPNLDSVRPVARQQEIALRRYYGWPRQWEQVVGEFSIPYSPTGRDFPVYSKEDPHLRSANDMAGYELWNKKYMIGRLENFIVDDRSWVIRYLQAKTSDWLYRRSFLVSTGSVESFSWAKHRVNLSRVSDSNRVLLQ